VRFLFWRGCKGRDGQSLHSCNFSDQKKKVCAPKSQRFTSFWTGRKKKHLKCLLRIRRNFCQNVAELKRYLRRLKSAKPQLTYVAKTFSYGMQMQTRLGIFFVEKKYLSQFFLCVRKMFVWHWQLSNCDFQAKRLNLPASKSWDSHVGAIK
jgi:hypothetical protein